MTETVLRTGHDPFLPNTFKFKIIRSPCTILSYILLVDNNNVQGTRQISNPLGITFTKTVSRVDMFLGAFANQLPKATVCPSVRQSARKCANLTTRIAVKFNIWDLH